MCAYSVILGLRRVANVSKQAPLHKTIQHNMLPNMLFLEYYSEAFWFDLVYFKNVAMQSANISVIYFTPIFGRACLSKTLAALLAPSDSVLRLCLVRK